MTGIIIETGARRPRSPWDVIAVVGIAAKGDGVPTVINSLTEAIDRYGERMALFRGTPKQLSHYGLVDAIETIYTYVQAPIIAIHATPGLASVAVAPKAYTFNAAGKVLLDHPNILSPITVTNAGGSTTWVSPADYTVDQLKGELTRNPTGTIPALAPILAGYNVANFALPIDWAGAIAKVAAIGNRVPTLIVIAGAEMTQAVATALNERAVALSALTVYSQPASTTPPAAPGTAVQLLNSVNAVSAYPYRTNPARGFEEPAVHLAAIIALSNYWDSPNGKPVKGTPVFALTAAETATLATKGITLLSDRVINAIATSGVPLNVARLRIKAQFLANQVAEKWKQKPYDLVHIEAIGQAIRNLLNREPQASNLPAATVNFNAAQSSPADRKLVYDVILIGNTEADRIALITVFVR